MPNLRNSIAHDHDFCYTCVKWWYLQVFFLLHFFKILIFRVVRGVKGQITVQNDKKFCPSHSILRIHTSYDCYLWFTCVKWYLQALFSFFQIFHFSSCRGYKDKNWSKMAKNFVCCTPYLRNRTSYDCHLWYTFVKWSYPQVFFHFLIFWVHRGWGEECKKQSRMTKKSVCHVPYLRNHISYNFYLWCKCVKR